MMTKKYFMTLAALLLALLPTGLKAQTEYVTDVYVIGSDYASTIESFPLSSQRAYLFHRKGIRLYPYRDRPLCL